MVVYPLYSVDDGKVVNVHLVCNRRLDLWSTNILVLINYNLINYNYYELGFLKLPIMKSILLLHFVILRRVVDPTPLVHMHFNCLLCYV